jgi:hypothetical protein
MKEDFHFRVWHTGFQDDGILVLAAMVWMEELIAEILECGNTDIAADDDMRYFWIPLVKVSGVY